MAGGHHPRNLGSALIRLASPFIIIGLLATSQCQGASPPSSGRLECFSTPVPHHPILCVESPSHGH